MNSLKLRQERSELMSHARMLVDDVEKQKRDMSGEEKERWDRMMADVDSMQDRIDRLERLEGKEDDNEKSAGRKARDEDDERDDDDDDKQKDVEGDADEDDDRKRSRSRGGSMWDRPQDRRAFDYRGSKEYRKAFRSYLVNPHEMPQIDYQYRDAVLGTAGSDSAGGYFALPTKLSDQFIITLNNLCFLRDLATIETVTEAKSLGVRQMTTQPSDASWSTEIAQTTPDTSMALGRRDLYPTLLPKLVNISLRLLQAAPDAEKIVLERLAYKIAIASENAFMTGSGSGQPLGIFTASSNGIPTSQDITSSVALASNFTADDLISTLYNIPQQYQRSPKFGWVGHRSFYSYVRKLKDNYGQYLLQSQIAANRPDSLLGFNTYQSEYAPTFNSASPTASQYVACLGDFSFYTWAEVVPMGVQRLVERFADYHEVGYLSRYWADGSPVLPNAFTRLKLEAS